MASHVLTPESFDQLQEQERVGFDLHHQVWFFKSGQATCWISGVWGVGMQPTQTALIPGDWVTRALPDTAERVFLDHTRPGWALSLAHGRIAQRSHDTWQALVRFHYVEDPEAVGILVEPHQVIHQRGAPLPIDLSQVNRFDTDLVALQNQHFRNEEVLNSLTTAWRTFDDEMSYIREALIAGVQVPAELLDPEPHIKVSWERRSRYEALLEPFLED